MMYSFALVGLGVVLFSSVCQAVELPKEVTPAIRAACEKDVRRLCVRKNSTYSSIKSCIKKKFGKLNRQCQFRLVQAGL